MWGIEIVELLLLLLYARRCGALKLWGTFSGCSEGWGIEIVESLLLDAGRCWDLKLCSHFYCMLGGVGY